MAKPDKKKPESAKKNVRRFRTKAPKYRGAITPALTCGGSDRKGYPVTFTIPSD
jgi:hypothetical protein